jgi:hypothetical protein
MRRREFLTVLGGAAAAWVRAAADRLWAGFGRGLGGDLARLMRLIGGEALHGSDGRGCLGARGGGGLWSRLWRGPNGRVSGLMPPMMGGAIARAWEGAPGPGQPALVAVPSTRAMLHELSIPLG